MSEQLTPPSSSPETGRTVATGTAPVAAPAPANGKTKPPLLEVNALRKYFPIRRGFFVRVVGHVKAVDGVSFAVHPGETLGLVGESGCGKTTTGRVILRAIDPTSGEVWFRDQDMGRVNVATLDNTQLKQLRRNMQMVFQDPYSSLNPRMNLLQNVGEPLVVHGIAKGKELEDRVAELLRVVGLRPEYMNRYPHAFSGGQRQRIGIARALALNPQLIVLDEPVSALDVSVQAQILNLLQDLQAQFGLTYLFIAHDLSVVEHISDRVAVMYVGQLVESATTRELFLNPLHPYTEALLSAVPKPDPRQRQEPIVLPGDVADPANPPSGCYFHPRCRYNDGSRCAKETPELREIMPGHFARCHYAGELSLKGVASL
ncbi:MAG TPA: oligopeptide/dipeptide ABC transporter ATP-binding protein [Caldilineaceae bacterium]|nr:oligopeptide/dipeptide ABC transporter ATP-binding protein [Caldilineaceae bacterium]